MKPVFPDESKYSRALFAAQLALKGTMLSAEAAKEICEELVRLAAATPMLLTGTPTAKLAPQPLSMERAYHAMAVTKPLPPFIEAGKHCTHGIRWELCAHCVAKSKEGG